MRGFVAGLFVIAVVAGCGGHADPTEPFVVASTPTPTPRPAPCPPGYTFEPYFGCEWNYPGVPTPTPVPGFKP